MFTSLKLERIGNNRLGFQPVWIKHVIGIGPRKLVEEYIEGYTDYSQANSVGSRGVFINYLLRENDIYHVSSPRNFKCRDTYFCRVEANEIVNMEFDEVIKALVKHNPRRQLVDMDTGEIIG